MQQSDNVKCWADCWNAVTRQDDKVSDTWLAGYWNKRSGRFAHNATKDDGQKRVAEVLDLLDEAGFSPAGAKILDIGCGPGNLSLPLARAGAEVTALDISTGMLDHLKEAARLEELAVKPLECSWWTADIDLLEFRNKFDLVIASMTPGIKDRECFDRMTACSKRFWYYSGFARMDWDKSYQDLSRTILHEDFNNRVVSMLYPFMYLYSHGFEPLIRFSHNTWEEDGHWEEVAEMAIDFLARGREFDAGTKEQIRNYYRNAARDGMYHSVSDSYSGMMVWSVG